MRTKAVKTLSLLPMLNIDIDTRKTLTEKLFESLSKNDREIFLAEVRRQKKINFSSEEFDKIFTIYNN